MICLNKVIFHIGDVAKAHEMSLGKLQYRNVTGIYATMTNDQLELQQPSITFTVVKLLAIGINRLYRLCHPANPTL
jgi:hypothetical protein